MKPLSDRQTMDALADRLVEACEVIDRKDKVIDDLRVHVARMTIERDGTHEANLALFADRARLARENLALRADLASERGKS